MCFILPGIKTPWARYAYLYKTTTDGGDAITRRDRSHWATPHPKTMNSCSLLSARDLNPAPQKALCLLAVVIVPFSPCLLIAYSVMLHHSEIRLLAAVGCCPPMMLLCGVFITCCNFYVEFLIFKRHPRYHDLNWGAAERGCSRLLPKWDRPGTASLCVARTY